MKIHLARLGDDGLDATVGSMAAMIAGQSDVRHDVCPDPDAADAIVFTQCHMLGRDWRLDAVAEHELTRRHPGKIYVYDERDRPWLRYPGLYVSMRAQHFRREWQIPAPYYLLSNALVVDDSQGLEQDLLFSFVGSPSARCRYSIYELRDRRGYVERTDGFVHYDPQSKDFAARSRRFAQVVQRSKFVLCPRGQGVSSLRLYEVLAAGRVPVILADDWVPPEGPVWDTFSLRWPERDIAALPAELARREPEFDAMADAARAAHREWFAPERVLTRQFDLLSRVVESRRNVPFPPGGYRDGAWRTAASHELVTATRLFLSPAKQRIKQLVAPVRGRV